MTTSPDSDQILALIAEGILDASDQEIVETARAHGVDVDALERKVREIIAIRVDAVQPAAPLRVGETVALRSDPARIASGRTRPPGGKPRQIPGGRLGAGERGTAQGEPLSVRDDE